MKVLLLNIDSKLPNIALKKIERYHQMQGDEVVWDMPILLSVVDKAYASCVFTKNKGVIEQYRGLNNNLICGGTGYDLTVNLPPEIDNIKLHINYGFTTRGCIRHCPFCFVPDKEGSIRVVGDIYDIWDGKSPSITLLDNNILALPEHFAKICEQLAKENISVDFNQGLDIRLVNDEICHSIAKIKTSTDLRFAFDDPKLEKTVREKIALLRKNGINRRCFFYVLVGYNTTFEQDLFRCNVLRELNCNAYIMRHENTPDDLRWVRLAEWANQMWTFHKYDFATFCREYEKDRAIVVLSDETRKLMKGLC